jgi:hypothetical protein
LTPHSDRTCQCQICINLVGFPSAPGSVEVFQFVHSTVSDILTTEGHTARKEIERNNGFGRHKIVDVMH